MRIFYFLLLVTLINQTCKGQTFIVGEVYESATNKSLPYVSIGVKTSANGTTTDIKGKFAIEVKETDTLVFSSVGYKTITVPANSALSKLYLDRDTVSLPEVIVESKKKKIKSVVIGNLKAKSIVSAGGSNQFAMLLTNDLKKPGIIEKLIFRLQPDFEKENQKETVVKIRVYTNNNGTPGSDMLRENLIIYVKGNAKTLEIDVSKYLLILSENGAFVGLDFIGYLDDSEQFVPFSRSERPQNLRIIFSKQEKSTTYSKFFGTEWKPVTHRTVNGELLDLCAKFGALIRY
jgi:hypothetical protein